MTSENTRYKMEILTENIAVVQSLLAFVAGLSPSIFNAVMNRTKWKTEKVTVEAQTLDKVMEAAGKLSDYSIKQIEMSQDINNLYEDALRSQKEMTEQQKEIVILERAQRLRYQDEIEILQIEVTRLGENVIHCSKELISIVSDLNDGVHISKVRIEKLEANWK